MRACLVELQDHERTLERLRACMDWHSDRIPRISVCHRRARIQGAPARQERERDTSAAIELLRRQRETPVEDEELADLPALIDDPELAHLKQRYRDELRGAVAAAIDKLSPRERLLLKYHYVDGHGIDRLADIYGVHRATAARWLGAAREALADHTHRLLITQFGVTTSELRSIARIVESQLDLSIRRLLA